MDLGRLTSNARVNLTAIVIGTVYGLAIRFFFTLQKMPHRVADVVGTAFLVMTVAFLFGVPFAMGYITVTARFHLARESTLGPPNVAYWIFFPWLPSIVAMLLAALFVWEGSICLIFAAPIMLVMASIGGIAAGLTQHRQFRPAQLSMVALLPVLLVILESKLPDAQSLRTVETVIHIHARL